MDLKYQELVFCNELFKMNKYYQMYYENVYQSEKLSISDIMGGIVLENDHTKTPKCI